MSPAARVRRDFRLGRPPGKVQEVLPLHPRVVWERAFGLLEGFRTNMQIVTQQPRGDVNAAIVFIEESDPDKPRFLLMDEGETHIRDRLSKPDVIALGLIFRQFDAKEKKQITFPYQLTGLNERGIAVLRRAVELQDKMSKLTKDVN